MSGVSVALCTRNGSRFIAAQIHSILAQTRPVDELIVSDDASSDETVSIVRAIIADHSDPPALRTIENSTALGVTANFQQAILACSKEVVVLSDQDDVWATQRIERTLEAFDDDASVLLVHSDARLIDADGVAFNSSLFRSYRVDAATLGAIRSGRAYDVLLRRNVVTGATTALRRELAVIACPFPSSWVHDEWLAVVASATGRIVPVSEQLVDYRQHGSNQIGAVTVDFRAKLSRISTNGADRNRRLLARAEVLAKRLPSLIPPAQQWMADAAYEKLNHEQVRSALPVNRLLRVRPVFREVRTGRYRRFGGGLQDVVRDLLQPLEASG